MKKILRVLGAVLLISLMFSVRAWAQSAVSEYVITQKDSVYTLSEYLNGTPTVIDSGDNLARMLSLSVGGSVTLDNLTVSEGFTFPVGELELRGSLSVGGTLPLTVTEGTSLDFKSFTVKLSEGASAIRIKGGTVSMTDSYVYGSFGGAFLLDYSLNSRLSLVSCGIYSCSDVATVRIGQGSFELCGGEVKNSASAAVYNDGVMYMSGTPTVSGIGFDVISEKPITLSNKGVAYSGGGLEIQYLTEFYEGEMTEILYATCEAVSSQMTVYDKYGREYPLNYFDSYKNHSERCFAAVYQPYSVKLYCDGTLFAEENYLSGEKITVPEAEHKTGYEFIGWYRAETPDELFSFGQPISDNLSLFARYKLSSPTVHASSLSFIYDGREHLLSLDSVSHPLDGKGGFYTYLWYKDGEPISGASALGVSDVSDGGRYSCKVTYNYASDVSCCTVENIILNIEKQKIQPPKIEAKAYNGEYQAPQVPSSTLYSYIAENGCEAGTYSVELTLGDPDNYAWEGARGEQLFLTFEITKAENIWLSDFSVFDVYFGAEISFCADSMFGDVRYVYSDMQDGLYTDTPPIAVGDYYVKATVDGNGNYTGISTSPMKFSILEEQVVELIITDNGAGRLYCAFDKFLITDIQATAKYNSGREELLSPDKLGVSYQRGGYFLYGDSAVILSYGGLSASYPITVARADYDLAALSFSNAEITFDGKYHTLNTSGTDITGKDGIPLQYKISGGGVDVGEYTVTLSFLTDSQNYNTPTPLTAKIVILPRVVTVTWQAETFVYDGEEKCPTAYYADVLGVMRKLQVSGAVTNAGEGYFAHAVCPSVNYTLENDVTQFSVLRADYDFSGVSWSADSYVYNGEAHSVSLLGLPDGVSVVGYTDGVATEAGHYTATAALDYDRQNYNPPPTVSHSWAVLAAEYDMSGFSVEDAEYVYDGTVHYPKVLGTLPVGADGSSPTYAFSGGAVDVSEGIVEVWLSFSTGSTNYNAPRRICAYVTVTPRPITVSWSVGSYVYNGSVQCPEATASECGVNVSGGAVNAGIYTAYAESADSNFSVVNSSIDYAIDKAQNLWCLPLSISSHYAGASPAPSATAVWGDTEYEYFSDRECTAKVELPLTAGSYYVRARVDEGENHYSLVSDAVAFEVYEVLPVGISVTVADTELYAFNLISENDIICALIYNNGVTEPIDFYELQILYESGDTLLADHKKITVLYGNFEDTASISVSKANYDLSDVCWLNTQWVYDGVGKTPTLSGLPTGVTVTNYIGAGAVNAGEYTVTAQLSYDTENYNSPLVEDCKLIIHKAVLPAPTLETGRYCAAALNPHLDSIYRFVELPEIVNAGEYELKVAPSDGENYSFEGGEQLCVVKYLVEPIALRVSISDLDVYLWQTEGNADYKIIDGTAIDGDVIDVIQCIDNDNVYVKSANPNYVLVGEAGKVHRHNIPAPEVMRAVAISFVLLPFIILLAAVLIMNRRKVYAAIATRLESRKDKSNVPLPSPDTEIPKETATAEPSEEAPALSVEYIKESETEPEPDEIMSEPEEYNESSEENECETEMADTLTPQAEECATEVDMEKADLLITDALAKDLVKRGREAVYTTGSSRSIINVDTLSENFSAGDRIDVNLLKEKSLVPYDTAYIKVLARGMINKPLHVYANDFSLAAVKMIALTGGEAVRVLTLKEKNEKTNKIY